GDSLVIATAMVSFRFLRRSGPAFPTIRIFQYVISADDSEISHLGDREHSLCSQDFSERILLSQLPLYLDERARRTDFAPLAHDFPGDQPVPRRVTSAGRGLHCIAMI